MKVWIAFFLFVQGALAQTITVNTYEFRERTQDNVLKLSIRWDGVTGNSFIKVCYNDENVSNQVIDTSGIHQTNSGSYITTVTRTDIHRTGWIEVVLDAGVSPLPTDNFDIEDPIGTEEEASAYGNHEDAPEKWEASAKESQLFPDDDIVEFPVVYHTPRDQGTYYCETWYDDEELGWQKAPAQSLFLVSYERSAGWVYNAWARIPRQGCPMEENVHTLAVLMKDIQGNVIFNGDFTETFTVDYSDQ